MNKTSKSTFIDEIRIEKLLSERPAPSGAEVAQILSRAMELKGLDIADAAALLNISDREDMGRLFNAASTVKELIYGKRLVVFAPLYISSYCANNCLYCGFRKGNSLIERKCLTPAEAGREARLILGQGHKRVLMLMGEDPSGCSFEHLRSCIDAAYSVKDEKGSSLRRINIEVPPLEPSELKALKEMQIGTYTLFQETYHRRTYERMHPSGPKSDYLRRLGAIDEALAAGLGDVGIGALFGLYDYRFEVIALMEHAAHLEKKFGIGPHTISVPRIEPAPGAPLSYRVPHPVSDEEFMKIVAVLRCAVPYTGIILSTREAPALRDEVFRLGISQISAGSKTEPGGYSESIDGGQFSLNDTRPAGEVIASVIEQGYIPSFCTGCYRLGRVGGDFMELAKPGLIKLHCLPNALLTLMEYLEDYADGRVRRLGKALIAKELKNIPENERREKTVEYLKRIENGARDIYF